MIQFLVNNSRQSLDGVAPSLSVLQYLRTTMALVGTKEGCAAGDCGACTVAVGELTETGVEYRAVNACITPVGSLHGKHLVTVEHLSDSTALPPNSSPGLPPFLHPVQQAMVDCHGAQCGFCTPGIVMSLYCWYLSVRAGRTAADRHSVELALSGNLCRCTGYQPIFRAAEQAIQAQAVQAMEDPSETGADISVRQQLEEIAASAPGSLQLGDQAYHIPASGQAVADLLAQYPDARLVAGATDLGLEVTQQLRPMKTLIYTGAATDMKVLSETDTAVTLGGALTYSQMHPALERTFPAFGQLLNRLGSLQIRNQGTLAGNVANGSPIGDTPPVLLALNATLHLRNAGGSRELPVDRFFTGYRQTALASGEFIEAVTLPKLADNEVLKVYKISKRFDDDISAVCLALWLKLEDGLVADCRIGCGGMAATPARAFHTEAALKGNALDDPTLRAAEQALAADFSPIDDVRASAAYRLAVAAKLLTRARLEIEGQVPTELFADSGPLAISGGYYHA